MFYEYNHGYVGLRNQGATCYMNALIQSLFMTPEFRNAIFGLSMANSAKDSKIVSSNENLLFQLQKIFVALQIKSNAAIRTEQFTRSLGPDWNFKSLEQRDSHEFLRYIFDRLDEICPSAIEFYRGTMEDFIKCAQCGKEECRAETFLDIPLAVKKRDGFESFANINESLRTYFTSQNLDDDDPCEFCNYSGTLEKGFRIIKWPCILTLQLKRFDMDWQTMRRYKLNDQIEFDEFLELDDQFGKHKNVGQSNASENAGWGASVYEEMMDCSGPEWPTAAGQTKPPADEKIISFYELFAIIAHSGSSTGGHYFAFIKNLDVHSENKQWFCFNDASVRLVSKNEVDANTFGRSANYGPNAYVLMYRKIDEQQNQRFMRPEEFPPHIKELKDKMEKDRLFRTRNSESATTKANKKNNGNGQQRKDGKQKQSQLMDSTKKPQNMNQQTNENDHHSMADSKTNNIGHNIEKVEGLEQNGGGHSAENMNRIYNCNDGIGEKTTKTKKKEEEDLIEFSDHDDYDKMEMGEIRRDDQGEKNQHGNEKMVKNNTDLLTGDENNDYQCGFLEQSTSTNQQQRKLLGTAAKTESWVLVSSQRKGAVASPNLTSNFTTIDGVEQISAADSNFPIKNNGIINKAKEVVKIGTSVGKKLFANNPENYEKLKDQKILTKIANFHQQLTKCTQLYEELIDYTRSRKSGENIEMLKNKMETNQSNIIFEMNGIFGCNLMTDHSIFFVEQGRLLFTLVLRFYCRINRQDLVAIHLSRLVNLLPKLAEKCEHHFREETVKTFSDEICRNFDYYNSTILLMDQMKNLRTKPEIIKNSEFMQRALLSLLCTAFGMHWNTASPLQAILQNFSWAQLLSMPAGHLKFNPLEELGGIQKCMQSVDIGSKQFKLCSLRNCLFSMIHHNNQHYFEKESVGFWLASHY